MRFLTTNCFVANNGRGKEFLKASKFKFFFALTFSSKFIIKDVDKISQKLFFSYLFTDQIPKQNWTLLRNSFGWAHENSFMQSEILLLAYLWVVFYLLLAHGNALGENDVNFPYFFWCKQDSFWRFNIFYFINRKNRY